MPFSLFKARLAPGEIRQTRLAIGTARPDARAPPRRRAGGALHELIARHPQANRIERGPPAGERGAKTQGGGSTSTTSTATSTTISTTTSTTCSSN